MNFSSILEYDELKNFSLLSNTFKPKNLNAIIVSDYGRYFLVKKEIIDFLILISLNLIFASQRLHHVYGLIKQVGK